MRQLSGATDESYLPDETSNERRTHTKSDSQPFEAFSSYKHPRHPSPILQSHCVPTEWVKLLNWDLCKSHKSTLMRTIWFISLCPRYILQFCDRYSDAHMVHLGRFEERLLWIWTTHLHNRYLIFALSFTSLHTFILWYRWRQVSICVVASLQLDRSPFYSD